MTQATFLTFLTFLTRELCFPAPARGSWHCLEVPPYAGRERRKSAFEAMARRRCLPNRRGHELLDFEHGGIRYTAGVGRFEDGRPAEIFLNTSKHGTAVDTNARAAAVAASLLLQHGCPLGTLRHAQTRNADGSASGPLARALDLRATEHSAGERP
jgi:hypothetical protein